MTFIEKLNDYWDSHEGSEPEEGYRWLEFNDDADLYNEIWDKCFIGSYWNPDTKEELKEAGYTTHTWERDSFGILVAGISKDGKAVSLA